MRAIVFVLFLATSFSVRAQYYYKDILGTREASDLLQRYRQQKVTRVVLSSLNERNERNENFFAEQQFSPADSRLTTITRNDSGETALLITYGDGSGRILRTVDSSASMSSTTLYQYTAQGQVQSMNTIYRFRNGAPDQTEQKLWTWKGDQPASMIRIKDGRDTTFVYFTLDESGRVAEERLKRQGKWMLPYFYYYNESAQLTDIVRYSLKARRLLPEYMFEYEGEQVIQKITVSANSKDYLIWRYRYDEKGLKTKEAVFSREDKSKRLGTIDYRYSFGS